MNDRTVRIMTGLITIVFSAGLIVFGVLVGSGKLAAKYRLSGTFSAAGQGLLPGSDVKVHGINIGQVTGVRLVDGRARVGMKIETEEKVPVDSSATIRPKTLFGEKFVDIDPGPNEARGPFLKNGGVIRKTVGGFELEKVLSDLYPVLRAVRPEELTVLLDTLAQGGGGLGERINRQIVNFQKLSDVQAAHAADTQQFLDDFAKLSDELAKRAGDVVAGARDLNVALPELNAHADDLTTVLEQGSRLASDLADVLEANRPFLRKNVTEGGKTIQLLYDKRTQLPPVVRALTEFFQVLAEAGHIPCPSGGLAGDLECPEGTNLAAIKFVVGGEPPCGRGLSCGPGLPAAAADAARAAPAATARRASPAAPRGRPTKGVQAVLDLVGGLLE
jgi:phospholipid/cholesterol/gamma-HCH transport system substrate-binding protein